LILVEASDRNSAFSPTIVGPGAALSFGHFQSHQHFLIGAALVLCWALPLLPSRSISDDTVCPIALNVDCVLAGLRLLVGILTI
jgi:hypothetical protein